MLWLMHPASLHKENDDGVIIQATRLWQPSFITLKFDVNETLDNIINHELDFFISVDPSPAVVCQTIDIFVTATKGTTIICFTKEGFRDPAYFSLLTNL